MAIELFQPIGAGADISVTSSSAATQLRVDPTGEPNEIRLINTGSVNVRFRFGDSTVTVGDTTGVVLPAGMSAAEGFKITEKATHVAMKTVSGTSTVNYVTGNGI